MTFEFKFPDVGEGITEGEIVKWHVKEGDTVKVDQVIADVETDKAVVEVPSPRAGTIVKLHGAEGDAIKVGDTLITIGETGESTPSKKEVKEVSKEEPKAMASELKKAYDEPKETSTVNEPEAAGVVGELPEYKEEEEKQIKYQKESVKAETPVKALPAVRKLAEELSIDLSHITGSGNQGEITKEDVKSASGTTETKTSKGITIKKREYDLFGYTETIPFKGIRKTIAKHMIEASTKTAAVTAFDEIDVTHLFEIRQKEKVALEKKGLKLTFMPFIIKATIEALKKHPYLNANVDDEKEAIVLKKYYNIGVAVDTKDGLIVPVIKIADSKSVEDLAGELVKLSAAANERKINLGDLKGGTFTITNIGAIGTAFGTPIVNYPEVAILLTGRIADKPVAIDGKVEIRKILPVSLTFDHRVTDGAEAARFMNDLKIELEDPDRMLLHLK